MIWVYNVTSPDDLLHFHVWKSIYLYFDSGSFHLVSFFFLCLHVVQKRAFARNTIKITVYYRLAAIICIVSVQREVYLLEIWSVIICNLSTVYSKSGRHSIIIHHVIKIAQILLITLVMGKIEYLWFACLNRLLYIPLLSVILFHYKSHLQ